MASRKKRKYKKIFVGALKTFIEYTKLTPKYLIDLAEEDRRKSIRERGDPLVKILIH
jgi:hypothetical protein